MNPWKIIGWIFLAVFVLMLAFCGLVAYNIGSAENDRQAIQSGTYSPAPSSLSARLVSVSCERSPSGRYTNAEVTIQNTGGEIEGAKAFLSIGSEVTQGHFSPYTIPPGAMATASFMEQREGNCSLQAVQSGRGEAVSLK